MIKFLICVSQTQVFEIGSSLSRFSGFFFLNPQLVDWFWNHVDVAGNHVVLSLILAQFTFQFLGKQSVSILKTYLNYFEFK